MENNKIRYYKQLDSTNIKIHELAEGGAPHGTVVAADRQTAGRGRRGRSWESPAGENIYMSILLRPKFSAEYASMLTLVMAYSAASVLKENGCPDVKIKWPNDLVLSGKKVCGILTEMRMNDREISHVIVGLGINVNGKSFSEDLKDTATSLYLESGKEYSREKLIEEIGERFERDYEQFASARNLEFLKDTYNEMLINRGREVRILEPGKEYTAYALGINEKGELLVKDENGTERVVFAGEVSVRGIYGYV